MRHNLIRLVSMFITLTVIALGFQNCAGSFGIQSAENAQSSLSGENTNNQDRVPTSDGTEEPAMSALDDDSKDWEFPSTTSLGYIYSGQYRVNPQDAKGSQMCEYPSLTNCKVNSSTRPDGASLMKNSGLDPSFNVHRMTFDFTSNGYLAKNPYGHIAVGLRARYYFNAANAPNGIDGRGFLLGHMNGDPRNLGILPCKRNMLQVESFFSVLYLQGNPKGNDIFPETCSDGIFEDYRKYRIELSVSRDLGIGIKIFDSQSVLVHSHLYFDKVNYIDLNLKDFFIAHVFGEQLQNANGNWNFILENIKFSQSREDIRKYFKQPIFTFRSTGKVIENGTDVPVALLNSPGITIGPISSARKNIYVCVGITTNRCANSANFHQVPLQQGRKIDGYELSGDQVKVHWRPPVGIRSTTPVYLVIRSNIISVSEQISIKVLSP